MKSRKETWLALFVVAVGLLLAAILGLFALHERHRDAPAPEPAGRAIRDARGLVATVGRRGGAGAADRPRASLTEQNLPGLSVAVGAGGDIVWAEGFGWADLENQVRGRARHAVQDRHRLHGAHLGRGRPAAGERPAEARRRDSDLRARVPGETVARDAAPVDGTSGRRQERRRRRGPLLSAHCERPVEGLQHFADDPLLFEPGTQYRYSSYGWILVSAAVEAAANEPFLTFMRRQIFEPLGMDDTTPDSATEPIPDRATFYFPRFAADPRYGPDVAPESTIPASREPARSCPRRPTWCASGWRSTAASCCSPPPSDCSRRHSGWPRARRPATVLAGTSRPFRSRANQREWRATAGPCCGGCHAGWLDVAHDVSRTRARRVRDVEHLLRGHVGRCVENRAGVRGTGEESCPQVMSRTVHLGSAARRMHGT